MILNRPKTYQSLSAVWVLPLLLVLPAVTASAQTTAPAADAADAERSVPEMRFKSNDLVDVIDFLRDVTGQNIYVNWKSLQTLGIKQKTSITAQFKNVKLKSALAQIMKLAAGDKPAPEVMLFDNVLVVATPDDLDRFKKMIAGHEMTDRKASDDATGSEPQFALPAQRRQPAIRFNNNDLVDVCDFLNDTTGLHNSSNWDKLHQAGLDRNAKVTLCLHDVRFSTILALLAFDLGDRKTNVNYKINAKSLELTADPATTAP